MAAIAKWIIIIWLFSELLLFVLKVGKPRPPVTSGDAAFAAITIGVAVMLIALNWHT